VATPRPIVVYYEHPDWYRPLFAELERRGVPHVRLDATHHGFDPAADLGPGREARARKTAAPHRRDADAIADRAVHGRGGVLDPRRPVLNGHSRGVPSSISAPKSSATEHGLVFNRMSPSAWKRGRAGAILYTLHYLRYLEQARVPVVNGLAAFTVETSKALQLSIIRRLGLRAPRTRVVNHPRALLAAADALAFPLVVKPNIGGSGAGIARFDSRAELEAAVESERITPSLDGILLLQEFHPPIGNSIVRVETLEGRYLYGIRVHIGEGAGFDLCPADICRDAKGDSLTSAACPAGAEKLGLRVEAFTPSAEIRVEVERIARASRLDVGGIEYLESRRDGWRYYYDVNALSNFVADPVRVVGFDPTARLVDVLVERAQASAPEPRARGERPVRRAHRATPVAEAIPIVSKRASEDELDAESRGPIAPETDGLAREAS
jgi:hypothetical protein